MNDLRQRLAVRYAASDREAQALFLAKLADRLTLLARGTYDDRYGVADPARLRAFNEAQNRILAQLLRILSTDEHRYPDDVLANILVDQFEVLKLDPKSILEFL
jgi:hypothetical protein